MNWITCCGTDIGTSRKQNQDAVSVRKGQDCCMAMVCDGVGGLARGEYASKCMKERLESWFFYEYPQIMHQEDAEKIILERMRKVVELQNKILYEYGRREGIRCATTVSAILLTGERYYIVHVGDSRIYFLQNRAEQVTEDQTLVGRARKLGVLSEEEAKKNAGNHVILQSVGAEKQAEILLYSGCAADDCSFVVCSDGFYHRITEGELLEHFWKKRVDTDQELGAEIALQIQKLKERGERDNISVAVIQKRR